MGSEAELEDFRGLVLARGRELYRDLPWRRTRDPYAVWVSEVMLQQTQVARVDGRWQRWLRRFPTVGALAEADVADVLTEWQGMGYNRRALSLHKAAAQVVAGTEPFPRETADLLALPGVGPATAAGIRAFAYDLPGVYLETNVRTVFLHELFPGQTGVPDSLIAPLVEATCPRDSHDVADDPRTWYYALLDYGAWLKQNVPNPSRRSRTHVRQKPFEGSHRQKRAEVVRIVLEVGEAGMSSADVTGRLNVEESSAGRPAVSPQDVESILAELENEGFCHAANGIWRV